MEDKPEPGYCLGEADITGIDMFASPAGIVHVPQQNVGDVWPRIGPMFTVFNTLEPRRHTGADIFTLLLTGMMQLHIIYDGTKFSMALITQIIRYPRSCVCQVMYATGENLAIAEPLYALLEKWARTKGANEMEIWGRPGWERLMQRFGFKKSAVVLNKELANDVEEETPSTN